MQSKTLADILFMQGFMQYQASQFESALIFWKQALTIYQKLEDRHREGVVWGNLGIVYKELGNYVEAIKCYEQDLAIALELKDRRGEGQALGNLGNVSEALGNYIQAIDYQQQSLAIARKLKDRYWEGQALGNLGNAYLALGEYIKAIDYQQESLTIRRKIKDRHGEGQALGNLGNAYLVLGEYIKAIECYKQCWVIAREFQDRLGEEQALGNLGNAYLPLKEYAKAINCYERSLAIAYEIGDCLGQEQALGNLGSVYLALEECTKAIEYHKRSLAIARQIGDPQGEGRSLGNLGNVYLSQGDCTLAINYYQKTLEIAREIQDSLGEAQSLNNLGYTFWQSGNFMNAEKTLLAGIEVWESIRARLGSNDAYKVSIFEEQSRTYNHLQKVLILQNKIAPALEVAERGRARAFVELLSRRLSAATATHLNLELPTLHKIKQITKAQNATFVEYSIIYKEFQVQGQENSQESELFIWVIQPTGKVYFRQVYLKPLWQLHKKSLAELVISSRQFIGARGRDAVVVSDPEFQQSEKEFLRKLYDLLILPIEDFLPTDANAHVTFIPQGALFLLPFPALQDTEGKYLIEKHTLLTAPSIQVLDLTRHQQQRAKELESEALIVGNPTMPKITSEIGQPPRHLRPLPGSQHEAIEIARLLKTQVLTGDKATKNTILQKMPKARIIHLATHGLLDDFKGKGVPGAIALAPCGEDDGILTPEEILGLELNAELLVLSACDTGRGRVTGDGVVGLSRSFISAGVSSIVVSLWAVPDIPTAFLMTAFYQNLKNNLDKAQALRQAMLMTMKQNPNPRSWAAFKLIGEAEWASKSVDADSPS
jgi:CHAT domain-containing protein/tetratricopeptide (TPR) repeat protein